MRVILHNIRSIYNVGSIFRTADAFGCVEKIYLCGITPAPINELGKYRNDFIKVSLGAEKIIPWEKRKSAASLIKKLSGEEKNMRIVAVEQAKDSSPFYQFSVKYKNAKNLVFIVGDERKGIPDSILKKAHRIIEIPMEGGKESLNVSIAFAIVSFWIKYRNFKVQ